jgi:hypothetical protein
MGLVRILLHHNSGLDWDLKMEMEMEMDMYAWDYSLFTRYLPLQDLAVILHG